MSALTTYWLSRKPGQDTEGPFTLAQLRRMFDSGVLTVESQVCRQGEEDWVSLHEELEFFEEPKQPEAVSVVNEMVRQQHILQRYQNAKKNESVALLLSFIFPMGGQLYIGRYLIAILGILIMLTVVMIPVVWIFSLFHAVIGTREYNATLWQQLNNTP